MTEEELQREHNIRDEESIYKQLAEFRGELLVPKLVQMDAESVLDVGARNGETLRKIREQLPEIRLVGVDLVQEFVESIREEGLEAVQGTAEDLPFEDQSFDVVHCSHTLEHCWNYSKAMGELFRVARKCVVIVVPLESPGDDLKNPSHHFLCTHPIQWWQIYERVDKDRKFLPVTYTFHYVGDMTFMFMRKPE
jgi:ubiquinone/menaquinone biosynthesis C-methylase UbiE